MLVNFVRYYAWHCSIIERVTPLSIYLTQMKTMANHNITIFFFFFFLQMTVNKSFIQNTYEKNNRYEKLNKSCTVPCCCERQVQHSPISCSKSFDMTKKINKCKTFTSSHHKTKLMGMKDFFSVLYYTKNINSTI